MAENGQLSVPPGFRFHPTDEELLYYYLRKKVSYEAIDLDVIREVDLNKLEPWDLKENCRIGTGPQNEWYFFSHKDKKYPTGTRTNRATRAGFWKATGRDKAIHLTNNSKRIGMRKTLVFYTGRAPHGQKTDWIMHEYRLDDQDKAQVQEDGWVVCRVFKKKSHTHHRGFQFQAEYAQEEEEEHIGQIMKSSGISAPILEPKHNLQALYECKFDGSMHLPQLLCSTDHHSDVNPFFLSPISFNTNANSNTIECSQNLLNLMTSAGGGFGGGGGGGDGGGVNCMQMRINSDWSFLDRLIASHQNQDQNKCHPTSSQVLDAGPSAQRLGFPFHYPAGCQIDISKFSN